MRVLVLTQDHGEASRFRVHQYLGQLAAANWTPRVSPFTRDLTRLGRFVALAAGLRRIAHCLLSRRFDAVWCEGPLLPRWPRLCERILGRCLPQSRLFDLHHPDWSQPPCRPGTLVASPASTNAPGVVYLPWSIAAPPEVPAPPASPRLALFAGRLQEAQRVGHERQLAAAHLRFSLCGGSPGQAGELPAHRFADTLLTCDLALFPAPSSDLAADERDLLRCLALARPILIDASHPLAWLVDSAQAGQLVDPAQLVEEVRALRHASERLRQFGQNGHAWISAERETSRWGQHIAKTLASSNQNTA